MSDLRTAIDPLDFVSALVMPSGRRFGDCMADFQRERFAALAPALLAVARGERPPIGRYWWEATKGASKDTDLAACLLWLLAFSARPLSCQVGAADADQAAELRKAAKQWLYFNPTIGERIEVQNWKIVCPATGSEAEIIAADVAGSHGARPDVLILNELSHVGRWEFAQNLMDNASKVPHGIVVVATNAGQVGSEAHKLREIARTSSRWSFHQFAEPAPWLDPAELEEAQRRNPPSRYNRLFRGVWSSGGDALGADSIDRAFADNLPELHGPETIQGESPWIYCGGLDLSVTRDFSAFVVTAKHRSELRYRVARILCWEPAAYGGKIDFGIVQAAVMREARAFHINRIGADPFQAEQMIQQLQAAGVRIEERHQNGSTLVEQAAFLLEAFNTGVIQCPRNKQLEGDLRNVNLEERAYGFRLVSSRGAGKGHGDVLTALSISLAVAKSAKLKRVLVA